MSISSWGQSFQTEAASILGPRVPVISQIKKPCKPSLAEVHSLTCHDAHRPTSHAFAVGKLGKSCANHLASEPATFSRIDRHYCRTSMLARLSLHLCTVGVPPRDWGVGSAHIFRSPQALAPPLHAAAPSSLLLPDYYPVTSGQDCTHRARSVQEQLVTAMLSQLRPALSLVLQTQRSKPDAHLRCNGEVSRHALHTEQHCTPCAAAAAAGTPAAASRAIWGHLAPLWSRNHLMYPMLCGSPT